MNRPDPDRAPVPELVDRARRLSAHLGREDLSARLEATGVRIAEPGVRIMVVGEFKQGKSSLVNELLGRDLCPVDDDVATAVPTVVCRSDELTATAFRREADGIGVVGESIDPDDLSAYVSEAGNPNNQRALVRVELGCASPILSGGVVLIDTPGVGGLESAHGAITIAALTDADAVVFVTDASQEMTAPSSRSSGTRTSCARRCSTSSARSTCIPNGDGFSISRPITSAAPASRDSCSEPPLRCIGWHDRPTTGRC